MVQNLASTVGFSYGAVFAGGHKFCVHVPLALIVHGKSVRLPTKRAPARCHDSLFSPARCANVQPACA